MSDIVIVTETEGAAPIEDGRLPEEYQGRKLHPYRQKMLEAQFNRPNRSAAVEAVNDDLAKPR